jgi:hypothetical protein
MGADKDTQVARLDAAVEDVDGFASKLSLCNIPRNAPGIWLEIYRMLFARRYPRDWGETDAAVSACGNNIESPGRHRWGPICVFNQVLGKQQRRKRQHGPY